MPATPTVATHRSVLVVTTVSAYDGLTESGSFLWWHERELDEGWRHYSRVTSSAAAVLTEIGGHAEDQVLGQYVLVTEQQYATAVDYVELVPTACRTGAVIIS